MNLTKPNQCPQCESAKVIRILYGLLDIEALEKEGKEFESGGCDYEITAPDWHCGICEFRWYDIRDPLKLKIIKSQYEKDQKDKADEPEKKRLLELENARKREYWRNTIK